MKMKKGTIFLCALLAAACALSGCGKRQKSSESELTLFRWDFASVASARLSKTPLYRAVKEKIGVDVVAKTVGSAGYMTSLNKQFGTGNLYDMFITYGPEQPGLYSKMIADEAILPVSDYVTASNYPNVYRQLQKHDYLAKNVGYAEGKHWAIPVNLDLEHALYVRIDWIDNLNKPEKLRQIVADEQGISVSSVTAAQLESEKFTVPETMADFYRLARAFTQYDPDGNGQDDTYGYSSNKDGWSDNWVYYAFGAGYDNMHGSEETGYHPSWIEEGTKKGSAFLARMAAEGIMDPDWLVDDFDQKQNKFAQGKIGMMEAQVWFNNIVRTMVAANPSYTIETASKKVCMAAFPAGPGGASGICGKPDFWTVVCLNSQMSESKREKALALMDYLLSDEGQDLFVYGIEGVHYKVEDGKKASLMGKDSQGFSHTVSTYDNCAPLGTFGSWTNDYYSPYATNSDKIIAAMETAKTYNRFDDYPFLQTASYRDKWEDISATALSTVMNFYNPNNAKKFMPASYAKTGRPQNTDASLVVYNDTFEAAWNAYVQKFNRDGGAVITTEYNEAVKTAAKYDRNADREG